MPAASPFAGAPDLNDERAIETSGVLFMEGEGEPAEITRIKAELQAMAASSEQSGTWLAAAMAASWAMAEALLSYPQLADLLAERHKIIGNNWRDAATESATGGVELRIDLDDGPADCQDTGNDVQVAELQLGQFTPAQACFNVSLDEQLQDAAWNCGVDFLELFRRK